MASLNLQHKIRLPFLKPFLLGLNRQSSIKLVFNLMPGVQDFALQLRSIIDVIIRFLKARRREEATIAFAALLLWIGYKLSEWLPKELAEFLKPWR